MIHRLVNKFQHLERDINALSYVFIFSTLVIVARTAQLVYECRCEQPLSLLTSSIPLLAALLVARVAKRVIVNGDIIRADERRLDLVRTTHHLLAISQDLQARVKYVKGMLIKGGRPAFALPQLAATIEDRYETLLERDAYKFLPGTCVDIITRMSGSIFGIRMFAEGMKQISEADPTYALKCLPNNDNPELIASLDELMADLKKLIDELFTLRASVDGDDR